MKTYSWVARVIIISLLLIIGSVSYSYGAITDGLVAYYPFNGNANDESGNGNNGTVNGAALTTDRFGNANSAYSFEGVNDYIEVGDSNSLDLSSQFTLSVWINQKGNSTTGYRIVDKTTAGKNDGYNFDTYGSAECNASDKGHRMRLTGGIKNSCANTDYSLNEWHHLAVTFSNGTATYWLDGSNDGSGNHGANITVNNLTLRIGAPHIGCNGSCGLYEYFYGMIDDIRIYNRALSESEIQELYQEGSNAITLTPPSNTTVSKGGRLGPFSISITNNTSSNYAFYAFVYIGTPDGQWITLVSKQLTLSGGGTISANNLYLNIPSFAPAGTYSYYVNIYDTNYNLLDQDGFGFSVVSSSSKSGRSHDWGISGWPDN